jgi:hypothetical protein
MRSKLSFCEQKETKKLYPFADGAAGATFAGCGAPLRMKFFCFFLFTKRSLALVAS